MAYLSEGMSTVSTSIPMRLSSSRALLNADSTSLERPSTPSFGTATDFIFLPALTSSGWTQEVGSFSSLPAMTPMYFLRSPAFAESTPILSRELP